MLSKVASKWKRPTWSRPPVSMVLLRSAYRNSLTESRCLTRASIASKTRAAHSEGSLPLEWGDVTGIKLIGWCLQQISAVIFPSVSVFPTYTCPLSL